jgi:heptosyltransferase-3
MRRGSRANHLVDQWAGIPLLNLLALGTRASRVGAVSPLQSLRRVGVMCSPALGDTLLFSGPLQDLRRHLETNSRTPSGERAEIVHICMRENLAAAELLPGSDRRLVIDLQRPDQSIARLRAEKLDLLIDFTPWQRVTALHTLLSGATLTAGFESAGQHRGAAYDLTVEHRKDCHELENYRALLGVVGVASHAAPAVAEVDAGDRAWQAQWTASLFGGSAEAVRAGEPWVVLHPWAAGTQSWRREWPLENWATLALRLTEQSPGRSFVVTSGPADRPGVVALVSELHRRGLRAAGFFGVHGLHSVVALLRRASLAVSVNTGIMHLAAILGTPTVGLSGPTSNLRWGPLGPNACGIGPVDGSGGYLHFGFEYPSATEDVMMKISVDQVLTAASGLIRLGRAA